MTKLEKEQIERLINLNVADMVDKQLCQEIVRKYIDKGARYCLVCDPQIRLMFKRLKLWWSRQNTKQYQFIKPL